MGGKSISFGALHLGVSDTVYEPAEDSFLLATYASALSGKILDMGTGCGIAALSAAAANRKNDVVGVDVNFEAVACAARNAQANNLGNAVFFQSDLFFAVKEKFDCILFNPPYLPTTREEKLRLSSENAAYDGGEDGLETFLRFCAQAGDYLFLGGRIAVIATSLNGGIGKTQAALLQRIGPTRILAQESFFFEKIALLEAEFR